MRLPGRLATLAALLIGAKLAGDLLVRRHERGGVGGFGKRIEVEGLSLHYVEAGAGPPVLLLHGLGASTFCFRHTVPALASRFRVLALDLPGYGFSTRDAQDQSLRAQTRYVVAFLDALGIEKVSVVGHSLGGSVAQRLAVDHPERVDRLVLADSTTDELLQRARPLGGLLNPFLPLLLAAILYVPWLRRRWLALACYDAAHLTPEVLAGYAAPGRVPGHVRAYQRFFRDLRDDPPVDPAAIKQPTLLLWGEDDRVTPPALGRQLQSQIAGSRLATVSRAGHWSVEERPDVVNPLLLDFLRGDSA